MSDDLTVLGPDGIRRSYDEHYDTMMDVEQDPTGAHEAIQRQHSRIEELEADLEYWKKDSADAWDKCEDYRAKLAKAVEALTQIERAYYQEATNPRPETVRRMAARMNGIARDTQNTLAELKGEK